MNKFLILSLIALGVGFAVPAAAKQQNHQPTGVDASALQDDARQAEVRHTGVPEPTYMAIQTRFWRESE
jgi:hypothetical protein